jgi:hypothetical protein
MATFSDSTPLAPGTAVQTGLAASLLVLRSEDFLVSGQRREAVVCCRRL